MLKKVIICIVCIILGIGAAILAGCGTQMTVRNVETVYAEPGQPGNAGVLSGAGVSSGGSHYKGVQTVGAPTTRSSQTSENGSYEIR